MFIKYQLGAHTVSESSIKAGALETAFEIRPGAYALTFL